MNVCLLVKGTYEKREHLPIFKMNEGVLMTDIATGQSGL